MSETIKKMEEYESSRQLMRVSAVQDDFLQRYAQLIIDDRQRDEFRRDLHYLVHLIYREAQEPLVRQITEYITNHQSPLFVEIPK